MYTLCIHSTGLYFFSFRKQVSATFQEAEKDGVIVPITLADYCVTTRSGHGTDSSVDMGDFYDEDYLDDDCDDDIDDSDDDGCYNDNEDDSGNSES